ncbi:MAG: hypothetical protein ACRD8O_07840 [Bryobacteraceae bacterium]
MTRIFDTPTPATGLAIGTFAAVPYVHLALESRRRNYPHVPVLVHDDASGKASELRDLCGEYGAEFHSAGEPLGIQFGDMSSCAQGLDWARRRGLELLAKMSRRFIPLYDWTAELGALAWESQYATFGQRCMHYDFGLRSECVGFHVGAWARECVLRRMHAFVTEKNPTWVEYFLHDLARELHQSACEANRIFERANPRPEAANAYGVWRIMPNRRIAKSDRILWHNCDRPADYARTALLWGLPYRKRDFLRPNE